MAVRRPEMGVAARHDENALRHDNELRMRLDKLSRTYDLTTMKIFMTVEALGENNVYSVYDPERRSNWESFLVRREACRLDLTRHEKTRERYDHFLSSVGREEQGRQFFHSMIGLLMTKGALDVSRHPNSNSKVMKGITSSSNNNISTKYQHDLENSFCGHLCRLFERKLDSWFDAFEAVNVRLTAHVKVSNFVRVLTGQVDALCRRRGFLYAINVKVTGMTTPRPLDLMEMCMVKAMVIQNGLAAPDQVVLCMLACHLGTDRPVLRLWEYRPTLIMDNAIKEADIDRMIDAGRASQYHELWGKSVCPPGMGSLTARDPVGRHDIGSNNIVHGSNGNAEAAGGITGRTFNTHDRNITGGGNSSNYNPVHNNGTNSSQHPSHNTNRKISNIISPSRPRMQTDVD
ncbi:hypothetical protein PoB_003884700 [Plakobranchus ocellatus]|uniref:Uncharacterized protein n=1 Tax=Plakobranchus ocellatus TaxID=259542 RepID=A0AAV4AZ92_9GAST|nr:hypothetical protein PoB_003884700 [Plakobranchus ocellatus]